MKYQEFEDLLMFLKNSVKPDLQLNKKTVQVWYDEYFKFYQVERLKKVFKFMAEQAIEPNLKNLLDSTEEYFGYLLHKEVEKAQTIKRYKKEGKDYSKLSLPCNEAVEYLKRGGN